MPNPLFFFGAGASTPFGIPTMKEMVISFEKVLSDEGDESTLRLYQSVKETISKGFGYADLESVFSVVEGIAKGKLVSELGFAASYALARRGANVDSETLARDDTEREVARVLLAKFKKYVRTACAIGDDAIDRIDTVYLDFFTSMFSLFGGQQAQSGTKLYPHGDWAIYTTNYDLVVEKYMQGILPFNSLFTDDGRGRFILNTQKLNESGSMKLVKLHGSIDWFRLEDGTVVQSQIQPKKVGRHNVEGEEMLYPIQQKDLYLYPWFDMFTAFKRDLAQSSYWIIVGYSFNDEFITDVFKQAMRMGKHHVAFVHPHASQIARAKFMEQSREIVAVNGLFGEGLSNRLIVEGLRVQSASR